MKTQRYTRVCIACLLACGFSTRLFAVSYEWNGQGATIRTATDENWTNGIAPPAAVPSTTLVFPALTNAWVIENNINGLVFNQLIFTNFSGASGPNPGTNVFDELNSGRAWSLAKDGTQEPALINSCTNDGIYFEFPSATPVKVESTNVTHVILGGDGTTTATLRDGIAEGANSGLAWGVLKQGLSTWTLEGNNSYSGTTTVAAGTLLYIATNSTSSVLVEQNAIFKGVGLVGDVLSSGVVSPGVVTNEAGTLNAGALTLNTNSVLVIELFGTDSFDIVDAGTNAIDISSGSTIQFDAGTNGSQFVQASTSYVLRTTGPRSGTFDTIDKSGLPSPENWTFHSTNGMLVYAGQSAAVVLSDFWLTEMDGGGVEVHWSTASERDTVGFFLYREEEDGTWMKLNDTIICAEGVAGLGSTYLWRDLTASVEETHTYKLVEMEVDGEQEYGPFTCSAFQPILQTPISTGRDGIVLRWLSRSNESYQVESCASLVDQQFFPASEVILGTPPVNVCTVRVDGVGACYRIVIVE